ncbi:MAG: helix-hairpin-helix domain-containing protein [Elusimicrobiota bacterium]|nr:helix-hairpin-helix domain-containing protein [Elusimicrobiota bacterium]
MYKKGINLNTVTVATLKTLPGIGDNLARSLALHRELKSEFVNPSEFSAIVPEHVYSEIAKNYNIYAVSPKVWKSRITNEKNKLYNSDLKIFFLGGHSLALTAGRNTHIINLPPEPKATNSGIADILHETGAIAGLKKFFGWQPPVKTILLPEPPGITELNKFLEQYDTSSVFCIHEDEILNIGSKQKAITDMIMAKKIQIITSGDKIKSGDFEIKMFYPSPGAQSQGCSFLISFGAVSVLLMFNMTISDQTALIHQQTEEDKIRPNAVCSYGMAAAPVFTQFCGNPELIDPRKQKRLVSDGNLIYAE